MIALYTAPAPDGWKVSVGLEELALAHETAIVDLRNNQRLGDERARSAGTV